MLKIFVLLYQTDKARHTHTQKDIDGYSSCVNLKGNMHQDNDEAKLFFKILVNIKMPHNTRSC